MYKTLNYINPSKNILRGFFLLCLLIPLAAISASKFNTQKRFLYVQPGQSVFSIVKILYPDQQDQWPYIIKKVVKINPHAFVGADATKIQSGKRIELPAVSTTIRAPSSKAVVYSASHSVGQVIKKRGKTFVISKKAKKRKIDIGSEIYVGDRIFTGVKGFVRLNMIDDAKIDLRCNSEMLIEDYQLLKGRNKSVIRLIKGSVRKITGSIGKMADDIYEMQTPLATVGVRGTEYAIRVLQQHGCDGSLDVNSKGLFVKVNRGAIDLQSKKEKRALNAGQAAHLANKDSKLKNIKVNDGVFDKIEEKKKSYFFGSILWLIMLFPVVLILRMHKHVS